MTPQKKLPCGGCGQCPGCHLHGVLASLKKAGLGALIHAVVVTPRESPSHSLPAGAPAHLPRVMELTGRAEQAAYRQDWEGSWLLIGLACSLEPDPKRAQCLQARIRRELEGQRFLADMGVDHGS